MPPYWIFRDKGEQGKEGVRCLKPSAPTGPRGPLLRGDNGSACRCRGQLQDPRLRHHLPPLEGKGHPADVGTGAEVSDVSQVAVEVINESALQAQGLQQVTDLFF